MCIVQHIKGVLSNLVASWSLTACGSLLYFRWLWFVNSSTKEKALPKLLTWFHFSNCLRHTTPNVINSSQDKRIIQNLRTHQNCFFFYPPIDHTMTPHCYLVTLWGTWPLSGTLWMIPPNFTWSGLNHLKFLTTECGHWLNEVILSGSHGYIFG